MVSSKSTGQDSSSRRGVLLGMTLAEVMLVVLFCLLLLLGKTFRDLGNAEDAIPCDRTQEGCPDMRGLSAADLKALSRVIALIENQEDGGRDDLWNLIAGILDIMEDDLSPSTGDTQGEIPEFSAINLTVLNRILAGAKSMQPEDRDDFWRMIGNLIDLAPEKKKQAQKYLDGAAELDPNDLAELNRALSAARSQQPEDRDDFWRMIGSLVKLMPGKKEPVQEYLDGAAELDPNDLAELNRTLSAARSRQPEDRDSFWGMIGDLIEPIPDNNEAQQPDGEAEFGTDGPGPLIGRVDVPEQELPDTNSTSLGTTRFCLYEPSDNGSRGSSISLGVIHIKDGSMTLVHKKEDLPNLNPVDFLGMPADYEEAYKMLLQWPEGPMDMNEFAQYGSRFRNLGDKSDPSCEFTMSYYLEPFIDNARRVDEMELYFHRQQKLNRDEFEQYR